MKLRGLLTESVIDELNLSKLDKGILKTFHLIKDEKSYYGSSVYDLLDSERIIKVSELLLFNDYDKLFKLHRFYKKYGHILFEDIDESYLNSPINIKEDYDAARGILLKYYDDNYVGKTFNLGGFEWQFGQLLGDFESSILEEVESMEIRLNGDRDVPYLVVYSTFISETYSDKVGCDMISQDEGLAEWYGKKINASGSYEEVIGSGWINIKRPKDFKNETLKKYFDKLIEKVKKEIIQKNVWKITEYMLWVESNRPPNGGVERF